MYSIKITNGTGDNEYLFYPGDPSLIVSDLKLSLSVEDGGCMEFNIYPANPYYNSITVRNTTLLVEYDGDYVWEGIVMETTTNLNGVMNVYAASKLTFLKERLMWDGTYSATTTRKQLALNFMNQYNRDATNIQQISYSNSRIIRGFTDSDLVKSEAFTIDYSTFYDAFKEFFLDPLNVYMKLENNYLVLTTLDQYSGNIGTKTISIGENLTSFSKTVDGSDLITGILPLGAKVNDVRVNISSVNDGERSIYNHQAVALFGYVQKMVIYDKVTSPAELKTRAQTQLNRLCTASATVKIGAMDLKDLGLGDERLELGDKVNITSSLYDNALTMYITKMEIQPLSPQNNNYTFRFYRKTSDL